MIEIKLRGERGTVSEMRLMVYCEFREAVISLIVMASH